MLCCNVPVQTFLRQPDLGISITDPTHHNVGKCINVSLLSLDVAQCGHYQYSILKDIHYIVSNRMKTSFNSIVRPILCCCQLLTGLVSCQSALVSTPQPIHHAGGETRCGYCDVNMTLDHILILYYSEHYLGRRDGSLLSYDHFFRCLNACL